MIFQYISQYILPRRIYLSHRKDCDRIVKDASISGLYYSKEMGIPLTLASLSPSQSYLFPHLFHFSACQTVHPQMASIPHTKSFRF